MSLAAAVQDQVWAMDDDLPVDELRPLGAYVRDEMAETRFTLLLMTVFGGLALLLAVVGVYGVNSYAVGQRSQEFGIRLAVGEDPSGLVRFVLLGGARTVLGGIGVGVLASLLLARSLKGMLFEVGTMDAWTYLVLAAVLGSAGLMASYFPARRAAQADPVATMRGE